MTFPSILKVSIAILTSLLLVSLTSCSSFFADSLVHANRQPIIKTPAEYGLKYDDVRFETADSLQLNGWLIPGDSNSIAIMVHPMNFTKYGYSIEDQGRFKITDIEVEFLTTAAQLNEAGHSVLMFDLRNHGESESSSDSIFGLGTLEWNDVIAAVDYINSDEKLSDKEQFFVSFCTGANATMLAMKQEPTKFENVKCMAAIQPISMEVFVTNFIDDKYPIFSGIVPEIGESMVEKGGLPYSEMSPLEYCAGYDIPTLFVQAESDRWTDTSYVRSVYETSRSQKEMLWLKGDLHRFDTYNYFGTNPQELLTFIDKFVAVE